MCVLHYIPEPFLTVPTTLEKRERRGAPATHPDAVSCAYMYVDCRALLNCLGGGDASARAHSSSAVRATQGVRDAAHAVVPSQKRTASHQKADGGRRASDVPLRPHHVTMPLRGLRVEAVAIKQHAGQRIPPCESARTRTSESSASSLASAPLASVPLASAAAAAAAAALDAEMRAHAALKAVLATGMRDDVHAVRRARSPKHTKGSAAAAAAAAARTSPKGMALPMQRAAPARASSPSAAARTAAQAAARVAAQVAGAEAVAPWVRPPRGRSGSPVAQRRTVSQESGAHASSLAGRGAPAASSASLEGDGRPDLGKEATGTGAQGSDSSPRIAPSASAIDRYRARWDEKFVA